MAVPLKPVLLFAHTSMDALANAVVSGCEKTNLLSHPSDTNLLQHATASGSPCHRRSVVYRADGIRWGKFRDGYPNLFIEDVKKVAGQDVIFLASFHSPDVIFEQLSVIYAMPRYLARSFTVILPYFPTGTMERVDTEGQVATAKTLAQLLSVTPLTSRGPSQIVIFDIHALQERFYFSETVIPRLESAIPLLLRQLDAVSDYSIAFPDDGAFKRFHTMFDEKLVIVCNKVRDGAQRHVRVKDGALVDWESCADRKNIQMVNDEEWKRLSNVPIYNVMSWPFFWLAVGVLGTIKCTGIAKDRHVVIVDDLVQTGGTLIECAKLLAYDSVVLNTKFKLALIAAGAKDVSAYVTHPVFPNDSWKQFLQSEGKDSEVKFQNFWITDSIPHAVEIAKHHPFRLLSLGSVIADALLSYDLRYG